MGELLRAIEDYKGRSETLNALGIAPHVLAPHPDAIKRALAHEEKSRVRAAYHRGAHWDEPGRMPQWWSDCLDQLRVGGKVIKRKFRKKA